VLVEPMQGRGGARVPPEGFMAELSTLAHAAGALVIADEVFTGSGRCGGMFASPLVGLDPDLVCLGKALGGGVPISACMGRAEVMDRWPESTGEAIHTSTFLGHPLGCAAALAVLEAYEADAVHERVRRAGRTGPSGYGRAWTETPVCATSGDWDCCSASSSGTLLAGPGEPETGAGSRRRSSPQASWCCPPGRPETSSRSRRPCI
jgi:acetylornithine/succinyldiaminopimelate/putrescine aminotransferase